MKMQANLRIFIESQEQEYLHFVNNTSFRRIVFIKGHEETKLHNSFLSDTKIVDYF